MSTVLKRKEKELSVFKLLLLTVFSSLTMAGEIKVPLALIKKYEAKYKEKYSDFSNKRKSQLYLHAASEFIDRKNWEGAHYLAEQAYELGETEEKLHSCIIQGETSYRINNGKIDESCLGEFKLSISEKYPILFTDILRLRLIKSNKLSTKVLTGPERVFVISEGMEEILNTHDANIHLANRNFVESLKLIDQHVTPDMMLIDKVARDMVAWLTGERKEFSCSKELKEYGAHYTEALEVCGELHKMGKLNKAIIEKFAKSLSPEDFQVQLIIKEFLKL